MSLTRSNESLLSRLLAVVLLGIFSVWFVTPSCSCQWEHLFGNSTSPDQPISPVCTTDLDLAPELPCRCEDACSKNFESTAESLSYHGLQSLPCPPVPEHHLPGPKSRWTTLSRGPPNPGHLLHSESRVYLRHHSFLL